MDADVAGYQVYRSETSPVLAEAGSLLGGGSATVFTDATAVNGTAYFYAVAALDAAGNTSVLSGEASATPIAPDVTAPAVPVNLAVTSGTGLPVTLAWDLGTEPDLAGYRVYRAAGTGPVSTSDELLSADLVSGPTFTDATAASEVVYSYAVAAVDTTGNASALSGSVTATPDVTAPGAPTGLAATAGDAQVELSWTAPVDADVAGYQVYRSETSPVLAEAGSLLGGGSATVFTDATAVNGTAYFYAVAALDAAGNTSVLSGEASATPIAPDVTAPAVPVNLAVTSGTGLPVTLAWDLGTEPDLAGYRVYRAAGTGPVSTSDELLSADLVSGPRFTDATAASEVVYSYAVAAVDTTGNASALSGSVTATPDVTAPGAPTGLAATAGDAQVELSWTAPVDADVAGYQVYRSETSPVLAEAGSLLGGGSATVFTDATAVNGTAYFYAVAALDAAGNTSVLSGEASATPIAPDVTAPAVPVNLAVTSGTGLPVTLAWDLGTEPDLAGYRVYRAVGTGPVSTSDELLSADLVSGPTFTDATAASEVVYSYAVAALDTTGNASALSGSVTATPDVTAPGAPTGLAATAGDARVELSWAAPTGADVAGYQVYRSETSPVTGHAGHAARWGQCHHVHRRHRRQRHRVLLRGRRARHRGQHLGAVRRGLRDPDRPGYHGAGGAGQPGGHLGHGSAGHPGLGSGHGAGSGRLPGVPGGRDRAGQHQ